MKRVFFAMLAVALLLAACSKPQAEAGTKADNITISYGFSSYAMFGADQAVINNLLNQFVTLSFEKTTEEMDLKSAFYVTFSYKGKSVNTFWVDKHGVFWLDGKTQSYRASSGTFDYEYLKIVYEDSKKSGKN